MLRDRLRQHQDQIVRRWRDLTLATYPDETRRFWEREPDRFANPIGYAVGAGLAAVFEELLGNADPEALRRGLSEIVRIRAVQEMDAGTAVGFVLLLKPALAETLTPASLPAAELVELREFEGRIDRGLLLAFDLFMRDRERVYEIRANEISARSAKLVERLSKK